MSKKKIEPSDKIIVRGARTHNLKNISVELPRNKMVVFTGLSGSGKSSLAFDTIFAEGQRRYIESLSSYARQFLNQMQKPDVDEIIGLSPAISIDQKSRSNNPRSTVATITEIYDYMRVMYARIGKPFCIECGSHIKKLSNEEIINFILERAKKVDLKKVSKEVLGVSYSETALTILSPIVRGRKGEYYQLLYDMLSKGFSKAFVDGNAKNLREQVVLDKQKKHDISIVVDEIGIDELRRKDNRDAMVRLSESVERAILESEGLVEIHVNGENHIMSSKFMCGTCGASFPEIEPRLFSFNSPYGACQTCNGLGLKYFGSLDPCEDCGGKRLRKEAMNVFLDESRKKINIVEATNLTIKEAHEFFTDLKLTDQEEEISRVVVNEIVSRLQFMLNVGLEYLHLSRTANTLSGGEAQRIRLASQLGSKLVGALYVLDEPTIGLHQRDNEKLIKTLTELRDIGNTIIVVEHDEDTIFASDYLVDIGPGAGVHGGNVVAAGYLEDLLTAKKNESGSSTLGYLRGEKKIEVPGKRREFDRGMIRIEGGNAFNIKDMKVEVPLGRIVCITGVSGSGKSTFMYEILYKNLAERLEKRKKIIENINCTSFTGAEYVARTVLIDQSPIGRTPRSNPATYTGAWTHVRDLFASSEEARIRGWGPGRFSFNVKGGRCEACEGNGEIAVEMHFLPTVYVKCDVCSGKRFMKETLEVKFKKKSIYDVLKMTVEEGLTFFEDIPAVHDRLKTLNDVGLGYLELGQSANTLSGGEAQRVKISSELYRPHVEKTIYLLDEPTIGLHYDDVAKLIEILNRLADKGNSVILIEHNLDIIKSADWVLDIGPEGGTGGGQLVAKGTPENVAANAKSETGKYLKKMLKK
ncbi:MAG: excinuclease ABC subunit UvrA [Minisyncoccia bacterium]